MASLLSLVMIISSIPVSANSTESTLSSSISIATERAENFLYSVGYQATVNNPLILHNLNNEYEAVVFCTSSGGYIIVNLNDLSIPEWSPSKENPFLNCSYPIYNGPLNYYYKQSGTVLTLYDNEVLDLSKLTYIYSVEKSIDLNQQLTSLERINYTDQVRAPVVEKYITGDLQTWSVDWAYCGTIASAICMRYFYDYVSTNYVSSNSISQNSLITLMQNYVGDGYYYSTIVNGLNSYFRNKNVTNTAVETSSLNFTTVKQSIIRNRPIIIGVTGHPTYEEHWIIAHGYFESTVDGKYLIVNDGWGNNDVWLYPSAQYYDGSIHFSN